MKRQRVLKRMLWIIASLAILWTASCATNPVTGETELMLLTESSEIQLGRQTHKQIRQTYGFYEDPALNQYIEQLGQQVAEGSHRSHLPFEFKVLDTAVINAFAVPGGFIYLTRGILAHLNNEAEVVGVIGHEIGHVAARHSAQQYTRATFAQIGLGLGTVLSEEFAALSAAAQFGVQMLFLKYSRDNERQADRLGVEYATRAGYDAAEMANFFHTLDRLHPSSGAGILPDWFSTHPAPEKRVSTVRALAIQQARIHGLSPQHLHVNREVYLEQIDGLVFGEDPRQGYRDEDMFYHPELRFYFPVPSAWQLNNSPARVQMTNPDKSAAIVFFVDTERSPAEAAQEFVAGTEATVLTSESTTVNALPARMLIADIGSGQQTLRVSSFFIAYDENTYGFVGFCSPKIFAHYLPTFKKTMTGFAPLSDPQRIDVSPDRIRIFRTERAITLRNALTTQGVDEDQLETTALLNGKELNDRMPANTMLKWIERGSK